MLQQLCCKDYVLIRQISKSWTGITSRNFRDENKSRDNNADSLNGASSRSSFIHTVYQTRTYIRQNQNKCHAIQVYRTNPLNVKFTEN